MLSSSTSRFRSALRLAPTVLERRLERITLLLLLLIAVLSGWGLLFLPRTIPIHYSLSGSIHPDLNGSKWILVLFFLLALALYGLLSLLSRCLHAFHHPLITVPQRVERRYRLGRLLLAGLKLCLSAFLAYLSWMFIQGAISGLNGWIFLGFLLLAALPPLLVLLYFIQLRRLP
ncbi:MAG: hypothetical protein IMW90_17375 [Thermogemmatispora sp.]|uniref:hypothetical protein n=1 Tax=Thermogemmatispora sp. TaxID=1968838 RepID=UPI0019F544DC|nr:hypothetical protein [Thermogemmatispora sp.]MBE3567490.1 hypothetical protein [Thermogemmatispora sp.]